MNRPSTPAPEHDPSCPATSAQTGDETNAETIRISTGDTPPMGATPNAIHHVWEPGQPPDFAKIRQAILSGKPGRIGFTRFSHLAFRPPYRRSTGAPDA
jgi:hypothetical protein